MQALSAVGRAAECPPACWWVMPGRDQWGPLSTLRHPKASPEDQTHPGIPPACVPMLPLSSTCATQWQMLHMLFLLPIPPDHSGAGNLTLLLKITLCFSSREGCWSCCGDLRMTLA